MAAKERAMAAIKARTAVNRARRHLRKGLLMKKIDLEPGMYQTVFLGQPLFTDNKELADYMNGVLDGKRAASTASFDKAFPGMVEAATAAMKELEAERFTVAQLLHRRGRIQASAGPHYMCIASNWIDVVAG